MFRQILRLAFPVIISQGIQTIMVLTDRYMLNLKNTLYTSVATTGSLTAISASLFFVHLLLFSTSFIGKRYGQNDKKACHIVLWQCFFISTCFIPFLLLLGVNGNFYFNLLGHPKEYLELENGYFQVLMLSYIPILYRTSLESYFLGINRSNGILYAGLIGIITNIPLTYLFVLGPFSHYFTGITGAAWGTFLANVLSLIFLGLYYLNSDGREHTHLRWRDIWRGSDLVPLLKQGSYVGLEKFANSFCFVCFVNMFVRYGPEVSTSIAIVFTWDQIAFLPIMGMYSAVLSLYSRFLGQGNIGKAQQCLHSAAWMTFVLMFLLSALFFILRKELATFFVIEDQSGLDSEAIYTHSLFFLKTTCFYIFGNAAIFLYKAALRSHGYSDWCFNISFVVHFLLILCSYAAVYILDIRPEDAWILFLSTIAILSVAFVTKYYRIILLAQRKRHMTLKSSIRIRLHPVFCTKKITTHCKSLADF